MTPPRRAPLLVLLAVATLLVPPAALAQQGGGAPPCADQTWPTETGSIDGWNWTAWARIEHTTAAGPELGCVAAPGSTGSVLVRFDAPPSPPPDENATAEPVVNVTVSVGGENVGAVTWVGPTQRDLALDPNGTMQAFAVQFAFRVADDAGAGNQSIPFSISSDATVDGGSLTISVVPAPTPPVGPSTTALLVGGLVVLAALGGAYGVLRRRRVKPKPRSQTLQRMERERQAQRARTDVERKEIQESIRAEETVRAKARDQQILEAKRADAEKMVELLRKRREAGQITELQFTKMVEKKQAEIAKLDQEIAEYERQRTGA